MLVVLSLAPLVAFQGLQPVVAHPDSGQRYRLSDAAVTIDQALALAELAGGRLVALESAAEEAWVRATFGFRRHWLGLEYPHERWSSGAPVEYVHWDEGEPSHGDSETFTMAGWNEKDGAWNDVSGSGDRFHALIELAPDALEPEVALPVAELAPRGVFLALAEGLEEGDLADAKLPNLARLRGEGTYLLAEAEADPLACWGLATQGVGGAKSDLVSGGEPPGYVWFPNLLDRIEGLRPEVNTAWLFEDAELSRLLASGARTDVRVTARGSTFEQAFEDVVNRPAPMVVVLARTVAGKKKGVREQALHLLDAELGLFLRGRATDPRRRDEDWLVIVVGLPLRGASVREAGKKRADAEAGRVRVPLLLHGRSFREPWSGSAALADVVPTVLAQLGLTPGIGWGLDGLALGPRPAVLDTNLLVNAGAEAARSRRGPIPGWSVEGEPVTAVFRARNFTLEAPGPVERGTNLFRGGSKGLERLEQLVDVSALAAEIDAKALVAELSGWLGSRAQTDSKVALECTALASSGKELERLEVVVGSSELRKELGVEKGVPKPGLVERRLALALPPLTRCVRVRLEFRGASSLSAVGADELALVLRRR